MTRQTDLHNYTVPTTGDKDYDNTFSTYFDNIDRDVPIRDVESNLSNYTPKSGAKFFATDTENEFIGDGSSWNQLQTAGPNPSYDSLSTDEVSIIKTAGVGGPNGTAVTVSSGSTINIPINTTTVDDFSGFDTTNDRYVVQKDGKYRVMAKSTWHNVPSGSYVIRTAIRVNNNLGGQSGDYNAGLPNGDGTKNYTAPHANRIFDLVSGDVIEATVTHFAGTSIDMSGDLYATRVEVEYLG